MSYLLSFFLCSRLTTIWGFELESVPFRIYYTEVSGVEYAEGPKEPSWICNIYKVVGGTGSFGKVSKNPNISTVIILSIIT